MSGAVARKAGSLYLKALPESGEDHFSGLPSKVADRACDEGVRVMDKGVEQAGVVLDQGTLHGSTALAVQLREHKTWLPCRMQAPFPVAFCPSSIARWLPTFYRHSRRVQLLGHGLDGKITMQNDMWASLWLRAPPFLDGFNGEPPGKPHFVGVPQRKQ